MPTLAVSAVGLDRPGIIAGVAERLAAHGANITDSRMAILRGHFAITLIVEGAAREALEADLATLGLEAVMVTEVPEAASHPRSEPTAVVSVHGADHPGIVAAVTRVLADAGVNVCDLQTRLAQDLYVMIIDAAVPPGLALEELDRRLRAVASEQGVTITLRPVETDVL
ncbi:MAG TPA: ACT domain-containing protein [Solirubrobacteraceae bacterium]|nr:ACT domain-containing protein [Solirubrobacteraceae bacterium]